MNTDEILKTLELPDPDRASERLQITLQLSFNEYARLHALEETYYNNRSVNDLINLLLKNSLDELIAVLPNNQRYAFDENHKRILEQKEDDDSVLKESE